MQCIPSGRLRLQATVSQRMFPIQAASCLPPTPTLWSSHGKNNIFGAIARARVCCSSGAIPILPPRGLRWADDSVHNVPCVHAARAIGPLLNPTIPSATHVFEDACEDIAIRLPMTPRPPTSSSSCCANLDSSGLDSTTSEDSVIGRVKLSICLHSVVGTVKSPVELRSLESAPRAR